VCPDTWSPASWRESTRAGVNAPAGKLSRDRPMCSWAADGAKAEPSAMGHSWLCSSSNCRNTSRRASAMLGCEVFVVCVQSYKKRSPQPPSGAGVGAPASLPPSVPEGADAAEPRVGSWSLSQSEGSLFGTERVGIRFTNGKLRKRLKLGTRMKGKTG